MAKPMRMARKNSPVKLTSTVSTAGTIRGIKTVWKNQIETTPIGIRNKFNNNNNHYTVSPGSPALSETGLKI